MKRGDGDPGLVISRREDSDFDHCAVCSCPLGVLSARQTHEKLVHMQALGAPYQVVYI